MGEDRFTTNNFRLLRVSLARIAEKLGFESASLPGAPLSWRYEDLWDASAAEEVGWHALAGRIMERVTELQAVNQRAASDSTPEQISDKFTQP
jgi:hypothetical protein